jgi:hypothetical protein
MNRLLIWTGPPNDWLEFVQEGLRLLFKNHPPAWLGPATGVAVLIASALFSVWMLLKAAYGITSLVKEKLLPLFYDRDKQLAVRNAQQFAEHLESDLRRLNGLEQWNDFRYAELEAEVEFEGLRQGIWPITKRGGVTKEKNLSRALLSSQERLILLEGFPGTGKSVALRHLALARLKKAVRARRLGTVTPIYVNLKQLDLTVGEKPTARHIRSFVLSILNKPDDRDIDLYLEQSFDERVRAGSWLFLFDSFDEIPAVLSATDADTSVFQYANAIADFLGGMNRCRGIVASREFKGPTQLGWPVFRILPLSKSRQRQLTDRARLSSDQQNALWADLDYAPQQILEMCGNAMFLSILCEYVKTSPKFPESVHSVFDLYMGTRFLRDSQRLMTRFGISEYRLRRFAEEIAFCMLADSSLGLSPARTALIDSYHNSGFVLAADDTLCLDALEYIKLARQEGASDNARVSQFTFSHRRFQEYFATCVVLREPGRISTEGLLTDGRWRETSVALCQMQSGTSLEPLQAATHTLLTQMLRSSAAGSVWPPKSAHLLSLLQDGFMARSGDLNETVKGEVSELIRKIWKAGKTVDRKLALQNAGCVDQLTLTALIEESLLEIGSPWIEEVAYRQVSRLSVISPKICRWIKLSLIRGATSIESIRGRSSTKTFLGRLPGSSRLSGFWVSLQFLRLVDLGFVAVSALIMVHYGKQNPHQLGVTATLLFFLYAAFWASSDFQRLLIRALPFPNRREMYRWGLFWGCYFRLAVAFISFFLDRSTSYSVDRFDLRAVDHTWRNLFPSLDLGALGDAFRHQHWFMFAGTALLLTWTPLMLYSSPLQEQTNLWLWPLYPLMGFGQLAKLKWRKEFRGWLIASFGAFAFSGLFLYMISRYAVAFGVFFLMPVLIITYRFFVIALDWKRLHRWDSSSVQITSPELTFNLLLRLRSSYYRTKFLRQLRNNNRLANMRQLILPGLEAIADLLDDERAANRAPTFSNTEFAKSADVRGDEHPLETRAVLGWDTDSRDELFRLIEHIRQIPT